MRENVNVIVRSWLRSQKQHVEWPIADSNGVVMAVMLSVESKCYVLYLMYIFLIKYENAK